MSSDAEKLELRISPPPAYEDPRRLELVQRIIQRTKEGKIPWRRSPTDFTATVGNKLSLSFVYTYGSLVPYPTWKLFTVRDEQGSELLEIGNAFGEVNPLRATWPDSLSEAVNQLFLTVETAVKGDIDKAIEIVEKA